MESDKVISYPTELKGNKPNDIAIQRLYNGNCIVTYSRFPFALFFFPPASIYLLQLTLAAMSNINVKLSHAV